MQLFLPCDAPFMRSCLLIPAMATITLALAACEVQPVVTAGTPPASTTAAAPVETAPAQTAAGASSGEAVDDSSATVAEAETIPEAVTEAATAADTVSAIAEAPADDTPADETFSEETGAESLAAVEAAETSEVPETPETPSSTGTNDAGADVADDSAPAVTELTMAAPPPPPPPPPPELTPSSLVGLSEAALRTRLGAADFTRREGQMETWQYRLEMCVVDYFLSPKEGGREIVSWAWRSPMVGESIDALACRRALAARDDSS